MVIMFLIAWQENCAMIVSSILRKSALAMADTSVQHKAEAWVIEHGLPAIFPDVSFAGKKLKLIWGGSFAFDAVSKDEAMVVAISTSAARTATGKLATAKFQKLKTDALYLLHLETDARRLMIFTEQSMYEYFKKAVVTGRFPPSIELLHIPLPVDLHAQVLASRAVASNETSPRSVSANVL
jgi:hypothetical protein